VALLFHHSFKRLLLELYCAVGNVRLPSRHGGLCSIDNAARNGSLAGLRGDALSRSVHERDRSRFVLFVSSLPTDYEGTLINFNHIYMLTTNTGSR
jgi:hypothetical protein